MPSKEEKSKSIDYLWQVIGVTTLALAGMFVMVVAMVNRRR